MFTPKVKSAPLTAPSIGTGERTAPAAVSRRGAIATGFTLIELMIVITIIGILAAIAVPSYQTALVKAREAVLREDLYSIRSAIDQFAADHGRYPLSLHELVEQRYLREVPVDPFTRSRETWIIQPPPAPPSLPGQAGADTAGAVPIQGNLYDLHSGSDLVGTNHVPYNEW